MRVYEFAKELNKDSRDLLEELNGNFGFEIKSHLSGITYNQAEQVRLAYSHKTATFSPDEIDKRINKSLGEKDLSVQVDDSHKNDVEKTFNEGFFDQTAPQENKEPEFISYDLVKDDEESKKTEEPEKTGEWTLGSGDTIPPEVELDEKAIEKLKKENEEAVKTSMESAENARQEYTKTVENIIENPDDWSNTMNKIKETQSWWEKLLLWIKN